MKKKILSFVFAICLILPLMAVLTACGGKNPAVVNDIKIIEKATGTDHSNSWTKQDVEFGESPVLDDYKLVLYYSDGSTKDVQSNDSNYSVKYYYTDSSSNRNQISDLTNLNLGFYEICHTYTNNGNVFNAYIYFSVVEGQNINPYYISLSSDSVEYGREIPEITLQTAPSQETGELEIVEHSIKVLTSDEYQEYLSKTTESEKQEYLENNGESIYTNIYQNVGDYYIYVKVSSENFEDKYSVPTKLTVSQATIQLAEGGITGQITATFKYYDVNYTEHKTGSIALSEIDIFDFDASYKFENFYGQQVGGELQWQNPETYVNSKNNGNEFMVLFVPTDSNYKTVEFGKVALTIEKGEINYNQISDSITYSESSSNYEFVIFDNNSTIFRPLDYINVYKWNGASWQQITTESDDNLKKVIDVVAMQAGENKYKIELKDKTNFVWNNQTTNDIEVTKTINKATINANFEISGSQLFENGSFLIPFTNDDRFELTSLSIGTENKNNSNYFQGSAEIVEKNSQEYFKFTPTGLYNSTNELINNSSETYGYAYVIINATPVNSNYVANELSLNIGVSIHRLDANPRFNDDLVLTPGKTFEESLTFMVPESYGTYTVDGYALTDEVPRILHNITVSFVSNSPIYYSKNNNYISVELEKLFVLDTSGEYTEVDLSQPPEELDVMTNWAKSGLEQKLNYNAEVLLRVETKKESYTDVESYYAENVSVTYASKDDMAQFSEDKTYVYNASTNKLSVVTDTEKLYTLNGTISNREGTGTNVTVQEIGGSSNQISGNYSEMLYNSFEIDLPFTSLSSFSGTQTTSYYVDSENGLIKIKMANESIDSGSSVECVYIFDSEGNYVGHQVTHTNLAQDVQADEVLGYTIQFKLINEQIKKD